MSYIESQVTHASYLTNINIAINNLHPDQSVITLTYKRYDGSNQYVDQMERIINGTEGVNVVPSMYLALTQVANTYNPYDPQSTVPASEQ